MKLNDAFPSKYLKSSEITDDTVYTISHVVEEKLGSGDDEEKKPVAYFQECEKGLVLNRTNFRTIADIHGDETDGWTDCRVALFTTEVDFQGKQTLAIRVRMRKPGAGQPVNNKPATKKRGSTQSGPPADAPMPNDDGMKPNLVAAAKAAAWKACVSTHPGTPEEQANTFRATTTDVVPDKQWNEFTAEDWQAVTDTLLIPF